MNTHGRFQLRLATEAHLGQLWAFQWRRDAPWPPRRLVERWVEGRNCWIACDSERIIGYTAFEHTFFEDGFVTMLWVEEDYRRRGVATQLMEKMRERCETNRLWTSTNLSNHPMQGLLGKLGYKLSGVLHYLDPDDPELIYVNAVPS